MYLCVCTGLSVYGLSLKEATVKFSTPFFEKKEKRTLLLFFLNFSQNIAAKFGQFILASTIFTVNTV